MISPSTHPGAGAPSPAQSGKRQTAQPMVATFVVASGAAEWLLTQSASAGAAGFGLLALAFAVYPVFRLPDRRLAAILPVLVAVPVLRLVSVALRPAGDRSITGLAVVVAPTLVAVAATAHACPHAWLRLRPGSGGWPVQGLVTLTGVPLGGLVLLMAPHPNGARAALPPALAVAVVALFALSQEVAFRGLLVPALGPIAGRKDVVVAAVIYAATFISYGLAVALVALVAAVVLGWCRRRTGSLVGVVGAHITLGLLVYFAAGATAI